MKYNNKLPAAANNFPSGLKHTQCMGNLHSVKTRNNLPLVTHHKRTVKSFEPLAKYPPFG